MERKEGREPPLRAMVKDGWLRFCFMAWRKDVWMRGWRVFGTEVLVGATRSFARYAVSGDCIVDRRSLRVVRRGVRGSFI